MFLLSSSAVNQITSRSLVSLDASNSAFDPLIFASLLASPIILPCSTAYTLLAPAEMAKEHYPMFEDFYIRVVTPTLCTHKVTVHQGAKQLFFMPEEQQSLL